MALGARHRHRGHVRQLGRSVAVLAAPVLFLSGCGSGENSEGSADLCAQYDEVVATAKDFSELDASETSVDELRSRAADFRDRLDELQEAAEGERLDTALSNLEDTLDSARENAAEAGEKAEDRVAQADDALEEVGQKWARVQALVTDRCN